METRNVFYVVKSEKVTLNAKVTFDVSNIENHIKEIFVIKKLLKTFNEKVMPEIVNFPTQLIEQELKEYLNEASNLIITEVELERVKLKESENTLN